MKKLLAIIFAMCLSVSVLGIFASCTETHTHTYDGVCDATCNSCGEERVAPHEYIWQSEEDGHFKKCNIGGCEAKTEKVEHEYVNVCDDTCDCGYVRVVAHDFATEWTSDETHHYHVCKTENCGATDTKIEHEYANVCDATCDCGYERVAPHDFATEWTSDETHHYHVCKTADCGATDTKIEHEYIWQSEEDGHFKKCNIDGCEAKTEKVVHEYANACDTICDCGYERVAPHDFATEWSSDETHHYHVCKTADCGATDTKIEHDWDNGEVTTPATPEKEGVKTFTCKTCEKTKTEAVEYKDTSKYKVTKEQWSQAMLNSDDVVCKLDISFKVGNEITSLGEFEFAISGNFLKEDNTIYEMIDGTCYKYRFSLKLDPTDNTGEKWLEYWEKSVADMDFYTMYKTQFYDFADIFDSFTFNEEDGWYYAENVTTQYNTLAKIFIKLVDGKLSECKTVTHDGGQENYTHYKLEYKSIEITRPSPDAVPHTHVYEWENDGEKHIYVCRCSNIEDTEYHSWDDGVPSPENANETIWTCSVCQATTTRKPKHYHVYTLVETVDSTCSKEGYEIHQCSCGDIYKENYTESLDHTYVNGVCSCGFEQKLEAIIFEKRLDQKGNILGYDIVECDPSISGELTLPEKYNGYPVLKINNSVFRDFANLTKIILPNSLIEIGSNNFYNCPNLQYNKLNGGNYLGNQENPYLALVSADNIETITNFDINKTTKIIAGGAFYYFGENKLSEIVIPASVVSIGEAAFMYSGSLTSVYFEKGSNLKILGKNAFAACENMRGAFQIPSGVTEIGEYCFQNSPIQEINIPSGVEVIKLSTFRLTNKWIESIVIGKGVKFIETQAFSGAYIRKIFYEGTAEEFAQIEVEEWGNTYFINCEDVYFYSETEPTEEGKFWYFASDGCTPLVWGVENNNIYDAIIQKVDGIKTGYLTVKIGSEENTNYYLFYNYHYPDSPTIGILAESAQGVELIKTYLYFYSFGQEGAIYSYEGIYDKYGSKENYTWGKIDPATYTFDGQLTYEDQSYKKGDSYLEMYKPLLEKLIRCFKKHLDENDLGFTLESLGFTSLTIE